MQNSTNHESTAVLKMHDIDQLATVATEFENAFKAEDIDGLKKLIKLCQRIETKKDSIVKSPLNKTLFRIEKSWRESKCDQ